MPIRYSDYPPTWKTEIVPRILKRAGYRCEGCKVCYHHAVGFRDETGKFYGNGGNQDCDASGIGQKPDGTMLTYSEAREFVDHYNNSGGKRKTDESGQRWFVVVLTVAHLRRCGNPDDDGPIDCPDSDLAAYCQSCHLRADKDRHKIKRLRGRKERMAVGSLFDGLLETAGERVGVGVLIYRAVRMEGVLNGNFCNHG